MMNLSGIAVKKVKEYYKIPIEKIFVFHDDLDLDICKIKLKSGGSSAGHNGLKNIDDTIGKNYNRIRIGIGKPVPKLNINDYVLSNFPKNESALINKKISLITKNINYLIKYDHNNFLNKITDNQI